MWEVSWVATQFAHKHQMAFPYGILTMTTCLISVISNLLQAGRLLILSNMKELHRFVVPVLIGIGVLDV